MTDGPLTDLGGLTTSQSIGAIYLGDNRVRFRVWAPKADAVEVRIRPVDRQTAELRLEISPVLDEEAPGYFELLVENTPPGTRYTYVINHQQDYPDPASRWQPDGVHGPSAVVDTAAIEWTDEHWTGVALRDYVIYELHVGTFSEAGTFDEVIPHLGELAELGITAIELMPVAQFPGERNWGYDGTYPFAAQNSYGGPAGLSRLVDAAHATGIAVVLDVVYNHLGPEGNYINNFGPYFSERYRTPWGSAVNVDGPQSDAVRHYFIENARYWLEELHVDALRLDAIHSIFDQSANPFLRELAAVVHRSARERGRHAYLIAESDLNDPRVIEPPAVNGFGLDAQWNDDFHHAVEVYLIGEQSMRAADFGAFADIIRTYRDGYVYTGQYSPARRRRHGVPLRDVRPNQLVVFLQNHDQIGNRLNGERL
ncbi:MAG TPA: malto-oligosyltrehalose trehalohydrolase, partial [Thermomicrobiaceae bacterium]|nr:malto-oligosyltrehalose trehalohydrolase [Thermomicrobiaceae bacterium]